MPVNPQLPNGNPAPKNLQPNPAVLFQQLERVRLTDAARGGAISPNRQPPATGRGTPSAWPDNYDATRTPDARVSAGGRAVTAAGDRTVTAAGRTSAAGRPVIPGVTVPLPAARTGQLGRGPTDPDRHVAAAPQQQQRQRQPQPQPDMLTVGAGHTPAVLHHPAPPHRAATSSQPPPPRADTLKTYDDKSPRPAAAPVRSATVSVAPEQRKPGSSSSHYGGAPLNKDYAKSSMAAYSSSDPKHRAKQLGSARLDSGSSSRKGGH